MHVGDVVDVAAADRFYGMVGDGFADAPAEYVTRWETVEVLDMVDGEPVDEFDAGVLLSVPCGDYWLHRDWLVPVLVGA